MKYTLLCCLILFSAPSWADTITKTKTIPVQKTVDHQVTVKVPIKTSVTVKASLKRDALKAIIAGEFPVLCEAYIFAICRYFEDQAGWPESHKSLMSSASATGRAHDVVFDTALAMTKAYLKSAKEYPESLAQAMDDASTKAAYAKGVTAYEAARLRQLESQLNAALVIE